MERNEYRRRNYHQRNYYKRKRRRRCRNTLFTALVMLLLVSGIGMVCSSMLEKEPFILPAAESSAEEDSRGTVGQGMFGETGSRDVPEEAAGQGMFGETGSRDVPEEAVGQGMSGEAGSQSIAGVTVDQGVPEAAGSQSIPGPAADLEHLYSPYAILVDLDTGASLAEHNAQDRIYPASLTKIMTAVLAVENTEDMEAVVTIPEDFFPELYAEDASMAGFQPGESARLKDLMYGILLPSGAECCMTFAYRIAGSEEAFVELMNQKAAELGLKNTHFCNVTGLHDPEHYSTVEDISILLQYALKNETFKEAFTGSRYSTLPSEYHPEGFTFYSTMFQYMDQAEVPGGRILGGKTGYTGEAGLCLASLAEVDGKEYILVTAKADGNHETEQFHILDAVNVYSQIGAAF